MLQVPAPFQANAPKVVHPKVMHGVIINTSFVSRHLLVESSFMNRFEEGSVRASFLDVF